MLHLVYSFSHKCKILGIHIPELLRQYKGKVGTAYTTWVISFSKNGMIVIPDFFTRRGLVHINHSFNESDFKLLVLMLEQHNINIFCRSEILAKVLLLDFFSGAYCFCVIHPQNGLTLPSRNDIMHIFYLKVWIWCCDCATVN